MRLPQWLRPRAAERADRTREVIAEAEQTRAELECLTERLRDYVSDLRARVRLETNQQNEGTGP